MNIESNKQNFISIIKAALLNKQYDLIDLNLKYIIKLAKFQSVEVLVYYGLKNLNIEIDKNFEKEVMILIYKVFTQDSEKEKLFNLFEKENIRFLPLKGCITRTFYPKHEMRSMADIDVLVELKNFKKVKKSMRQLGYSLNHGGGNHDAYFKLPVMNVEIHRNMIDESYNTSIYYKNIWNKITFKGNYGILSNEDFYVYMIAHSAKHFSHGGTGIKSICDVWVYLNKFNNSLDYKYISEQLEKLNLLTYGVNLKDLTLKLFNDEQLDKNLQLILDYYLDSGTYGNVKYSSIVSGFFGETVDINESKKKYIFKRLFPSFKIMKRRNPILKKLPFLLPWFYFTRILGAIFKTSSVKSQVNAINSINNKDIEQIKKVHEISGMKKD